LLGWGRPAIAGPRAPEPDAWLPLALVAAYPFDPASPTLTPVPTATPTATETPTVTATSTASATATATLTPYPECYEYLANGGFEADAAWTFADSPAPATYSAAAARSGARGLRAGIVDGPEQAAYSSAGQLFSIPAGAPAVLTFAWFPMSQEGDRAGGMALGSLGVEALDSPDSGDLQYVVLTNPDDSNPVAVMVTRSNARSWQQVRYEIPPALSGRPLRLVFGVKSDGLDGTTAMYVDDASVALCWGHSDTPAPSATPTRTASPAASATPTTTATVHHATASPTPTVTPVPLQWDPRLTQRGAVLVAAQPGPGQGYWRLVKGAWFDEAQSEGRHHIFVDALNADGAQQSAVPVKITPMDGATVWGTLATVARPYVFDWANFAMYARAPAYRAVPASGAPADAVTGLGMGSIEAPLYAIHTCYGFTWRWTVAPGAASFRPLIPR
jgi:hypothetical protein